MSRIFWDTNVFIYLFENHAIHQKEAMALRTKMLVRGDELITSWVTVGEIQVQSPRRASIGNYSKYRDVIVQTARVLAFEEVASDRYREVRQLTSVRGPDAMQLACAAAAGVEIFVTNDKKLHGLQVPGIHFIASIASAEHLL
ncbi:PIN domain-containing protein [Granulicella mallensis]|jgi:predicted nucleic acid-binding protein|uniref:PilT protein domain protein n=2 Tax=Granulicella mallensis TaxID=940614 RepID=G8NZF5_GRAMM|nr:PIN domain-containing protein [Granulicella mallensis]AEU37983.1 PilT protein domain protein [Granulicella mallensis MP5ACTX8]MBB5062026.1 putative nucleic acid-binding protein [Granulicella mallensis]